MQKKNQQALLLQWKHITKHMRDSHNLNWILSNSILSPNIHLQWCKQQKRAHHKQHGIRKGNYSMRKQWTAYEYCLCLINFEISSILGCDTMWYCIWLPKFQKNKSPPSSGSVSSHNITISKTPDTLATAGTANLKKSIHVYFKCRNMAV